MKEYAKAAKESGAETMIGGLHAQRCYSRFFTDYIDVVFTGFDVAPIRDHLRGDPSESISSMCWKKDGKWTVNKAVPAEINDLPRPDRNYFYQHSDRYRYLELLPAAHVRTSYCCPYKCSFCLRNILNCGRYSVRDIADVVDEIQGIECENIYIIDDDFLFGEERLREFIRLIRSKNIRKRFVCYGRADFIAAHPDLMQELKSIGFYYILVGLEAADERYLESYNKRSDMEANVKAVSVLNEAGINIMGMFIVDLDFTGKDFRRIWRWVKRYGLKHAAVSIFTPEMNSTAIRSCRDRLITRDPAHWDYLHVVARPEKLSVRGYYFYYHILLIRLFLRAWRQGIYDFIDYGFFIKSFINNMFRFGG